MHRLCQWLKGSISAIHDICDLLYQDRRMWPYDVTPQNLSRVLFNYYFNETFLTHDGAFCHIPVGGFAY